MKIIDKLKSAWRAATQKQNSSAELSSDEVTKEEVFPRPAAKKTKRSRPTNSHYQMIDPDDNTVDTGKS